MKTDQLAATEVNKIISDGSIKGVKAKRERIKKRLTGILPACKVREWSNEPRRRLYLINKARAREGYKPLAY